MQPAFIGTTSMTFHAQHLNCSEPLGLLLEAKKQRSLLLFFDAHLPKDSVLQMSASKNNENDGSNGDNCSSANCFNFAVEVTEIARFLETNKFCDFSEKSGKFSFKKEFDFFKIRKGGKLAGDCVSNASIS